VEANALAIARGRQETKAGAAEQIRAKNKARKNRTS
jgi:hypothetical protein